MSLDQPTVASCGSGLTACWIALAAEAALNKEIPVFVVSDYLYSFDSLILNFWFVVCVHRALGWSGTRRVLQRA